MTQEFGCQAAEIGIEISKLRAGQRSNVILGLIDCGGS
jgi:hypothetical protein